MKKTILFLLMPFLFITADVQAQEWCIENTSDISETNFYAKLLTGANFLQNTTINGNKATYQTGYMVAGSLGYCLYDHLYLEGEYAFRRNAIKKIHFFGQGSAKNGYFQTSSYMVNLLWNLPLCCGCALRNIQPFIGGGVGCDFQRIHSSNSRIVFDQKWNHFAWQARAGFAYSIFCNAVITLEYKFHQGGCHFYNHFIGVGFIYKFGFLR